MSKQPTLVLLLLLAGVACGKRPAEAAEAGPGAPAAAPAPPPLDPRLAELADLAFVPADARAIVRVDLGGVAARSSDPAQTRKTFDFILRAQQPVAWQVLSSAGISVGQELGTLYLVAGAAPAGKGDPYLLAATGDFDTARLGEGLRKTGAIAEPQPSGAIAYRWKRPPAAVGAAEGPGALGEAAVGVAPRLLVFGPPALVLQALEKRALDVRHGPLAGELLAVDRTATVWGVAAGVAALPGLERGHFQASLASSGGDAALVLRARFGSREQAEAFGEKLKRVLAAATLFGDKTPLGATLGRMRDSTKLTVEDTTLVASSASPVSDAGR